MPVICLLFPFSASLVEHGAIYLVEETDYALERRNCGWIIIGCVGSGAVKPAYCVFALWLCVPDSLYAKTLEEVRHEVASGYGVLQSQS